MPADFTIKAGDTQPLLAQTLVYSNGEKVNLTGATLTFELRQLTTGAPVVLTGVAAVTNVLEGGVYFRFSAADTRLDGNYAANWIVDFAHGGGRQTFPTEGYLWIQIQPNLEAEPAQIVGLGEVKDKCHIPADDHTHDARLIADIEAVRPLIEEQAGPILLRTYEEWYEGGHVTISLRHKPSCGYGTSPVLNLLAVTEYRGPIPYNLIEIGNPAAGQVYSTMLNGEIGYIARRSSGGGVLDFFCNGGHADQDVFVVYQAGQATVPANVKRAALETIRWWNDTEQNLGKGRLAPADAEVASMPRTALPYHVMALLAPTKRAPSCA